MADTIIMPIDARKAALETKRTGYLNTLTLRLYQNNYTPVVGSVLADFTEANFKGYTGQSLTDFGGVYENASHNAESDSGVHTFTYISASSGSSSNDIYGWYTVDAFGRVGPAARFSAPVPITLNGDGLSLSIQILFEDGALA